MPGSRGDTQGRSDLDGACPPCRAGKWPPPHARPAWSPGGGTPPINAERTPEGNAVIVTPPSRAIHTRTCGQQSNRQTGTGVHGQGESRTPQKHQPTSQSEEEQETT